MKQSPVKIASRLMAPSSTSAVWSYDQVRTLIVEAIREERGEIEQRPARKGKPG